jgi:hypothetical protein
MANRDTPRGFWPIRSASGGEIRTDEFLIDSNTATVLYKGDLLIAEANGNIEAATADDGVLVLGVFAGCSYTDADGEIHYSDMMPATKTNFTNMKGFVWNARDYYFGVQADSGTAPAATDVFATANHVKGAGDSVRKISGHELDSSDIGTGLQLRIMGKVDRPDNDWGEHVDLIVLINENIYKDTASI